MKKSKNKKNLILFVVAGILFLASSVGTIFAFRNQSIFRGFETDITAINVMFKFNGNTYLDAIGSSEIDILKGASGDSYDIPMAIEVTGSKEIAVEYTIHFTLEKTNSDTEATDITQAIEAYYYNGSRYEFLCMLDDMPAYGDTDSDKIGLSGIMAVGISQTVPLRLVYSAAAGDEFFEHSGSGFIIHAKAEASINTTSEKYTFVSTAKKFAQVFESENTVGKTIILADNITISQDLTSSGIVGIELNGYNLTLNNPLIIDCGSLTEHGRLGITNKAGSGGSISGSQKIYIRNLSNCYFIDDSLTNIFDGEDISIDLSRDNVNAVFDDFLALIDERAAKLSNGSIYLSGTDVSFIFDDLSCYVNGFNMQIDADGIIKKENGKYIIKAYDDFTSNFYFSFYFNGILDTINVSGMISNTVTIRGNSPKAIADILAANIPELISSSQYFKKYDPASGAYIEWYVDDKLGGNLLTSKGEYRKSGLDGMLSALKSDTAYDDQTVDIYIKITTPGNVDNDNNSKESATGTFCYSKKAVVVNPEERTSLIFDNRPITLRDGEGSVYDIYSDYLTEYKSASNLSGIIIIPIETGINDFLITKSKIVDGKTYDTLEIKADAVIQKNTEYTQDIKITFVYKDADADPKSFTVTKTINISGEYANITKYDVSYTLQSSFSLNDYIEGKDYDFDVYGALVLTNIKDGDRLAFVDYEIQGDAAKYIIVTYSFKEIDKADMVNQVAYFYKSAAAPTDETPYYESESTFYILENTKDKDGKIIYKDGVTYYQRAVAVEVLPSKAPTADVTTVTIKATLYSLQNGAPQYLFKTSDNIYTAGPYDAGAIKKVYTDINNDPYYDSTKSGSEADKYGLEYALTMEITGILHNEPTQIADYNLYTILRNIYDTNSDGLISSKEAEKTTALVNYYAKTGSSGYVKAAADGTYYIDCSNVTISSLKGLEYFKGITGIDLTNTKTVDVTYLAQLPVLKYLNLSNNLVTDISKLEFSDSLTYLNLSNNQITSIESLRYLPQIKTLYLDNNKILDFDALIETTSLRLLSILGMKSAAGASFTVDVNAMYAFSLMSINNYVSASDNLSIIYDVTIDITPEMKIAAKVMHDLQEINRVYKILYLPSVYYYTETSGGGTVTETAYRLFWYTDDANLIIKDYSGTLYQGYEITSPLFDKSVNLNLKVFTGSGTVSYNLSRDFKLTLESGSPTETYIYVGGTTGYMLASEAIPDPVLRNLLFEQFNYDTSEVNTVDIGGGIVIKEKYVISQADIEYYTDYTYGLYDWSNKGITNLSGIEYFSDILKTTLDLSGNKLDLTVVEKEGELTGALIPLSSLTNLKGLTLGGQEYDFSQISKPLTFNPSTGAVLTRYGLSNLTELTVYECYGLEKDEVLNTLYGVYRANNVSIYIEQGATAWDPYAKIMAKKVSGLISTLPFYTLNQEYDIGGTTANPYEFTLYNVDYKFTITAATLYERHSTSSKYFTVTTSTGKIKYVYLTGTQESVYVKLSIRSTITDGRSNISYTDYFVQLIAYSAEDIIFVSDLGNQTIGQLFSSREIKDVVLNKLFVYFSAQNITAPNGKYIITKAQLNAAMAGVSSLTLSGTYEKGDNMLQGLKHLTTVKTLYITRDAYFGDGSELINIVDLTINNSAVILSGLSTPLPELKSFTSTSFYLFNVTLSSAPAGAAAEVKSALKYMPNLAKLSLATPTGTVAYIDDLSFLSALIVNGKSSLTELDIRGVGSAVAVGNTDAGYVRDVYKAAIANGKTASQLLYRIGSPTAKAATGYFKVITENSFEVMAYYTAFADSDYAAKWGGFDNITKSTFEMTTDLDDYNIIMGGSVQGSTATSYVYDFGLKITGSYWLTNKKTTLATSDTILLPANLQETYYGLKYGASSDTLRGIPVTWKVFVSKSTTSFSTYTYNTAAPYKTDTTLALSGANFGNCYMVVIGTTVPPEGGTARSYIYFFQVGSGDSYYCKITDDTLRAWMFVSSSDHTMHSATGNTANGTTAVTATTTTFSITASAFYNSTFAGYLGLNGITLSTAAASSVPLYFNSVTGLDVFLDIWAAKGYIDKTKVTSFTLQYPRFEDISPIYWFSNLTTLSFNSSAGNSANNGFVKINAATGAAFDKLISFTLTGCYNITPEALAAFAEGLANQTRASFTLYINSTKCAGQLSVFDSIKVIANKVTGTKQVSLRLNNGTAATTTVAAIDTFLNDVSGFYTSGISSELYTKGTENITVSGRAYTLVMNSYVNSMLKSFSVANSVDVRLTVTYTGQFTGTYIERKYNTTGISSPLRFGTGTGQTISAYDTQLIGYLMSTGNMTLNANGSYELKANISITSDQGIAANSSALSSSFSISITPRSNVLLQESVGPTASALTNGSFTNPANNVSGYMLLTHQFVSDYIFSTNNYPTYNMILPTHIYIGGTLTAITWTAVTSTYAFATPTPALTSNNFISDYTVDSVVKGKLFILDNTNILTNRINEGESKAIILRGSAGTNASRSITITRVEDESTTTIAAPSYILYVQVTESEGKLLAGDYELGDAADYIIISLDGDNKITDGAAVTKVVSAEQIFKSSRLIQYLYTSFNGASFKNEAGGNLSQITTLSDADGVSQGMYIPTAHIINMSKMEIGTTSSWVPISSLDGLEIFTNLKEFTVRGGTFSNIDALAGMHLTKFYYVNAESTSSQPNDPTQSTYDVRNYKLNDFSPLIEGSKNSLIEFAYNGLGTTQMTDLSFLLSFGSQLAAVYIAPRNYTAVTPYALSYFRTSAGQYVLSNLYSRGVYVYTYSNNATTFKLGVDTTNTKTFDQTTVTALLPPSEYRQAADVFDVFVTDGIAMELHGNYLLDITPSVDGATGVVSFIAPATINYQGSLYLIDWHTLDKDYTVSYKYTDADGTTTLTPAQAQTLIESTEYYAAEKSGTAKLYVEIKINNLDTENLSNYLIKQSARISLGAGNNQMYFERMFTLRFV